MRRSAAPSVRAAKKMKFCTPFLAGSKENTTGNSTIATTISLAKQSNPNQMTSDRIECEVSSKIDQATLGPCTSENDLKVTTNSAIPTNCANLLKPEDKLKFNNLKPLSHTPVTSSSAPFKCPLKHSSTENVHSAISDEKENTYLYFNVVWGKMSKKKHKKWEGDGILITKGRNASLKDLEGKEIAKGTGYKSSELESLQEGNTLCIGGKEIEVMSCLNAEDYLSGKCFQQHAVSSPPVINVFSKPPSKQTGLHKPFVCNVKRDVKTETRKAVTPRHDVNSPGALVMPRPSASHQLEHNRGGLDIIDVVVDPHLSQHLRPHQREGVVFLYECVMGLRNFNGNGVPV